MHQVQQHVRAQARRPVTTAAHVAGGLLPLELCQGYTLELAAAPRVAGGAEPAAELRACAADVAGARVGAGGAQLAGQAGAGAPGAGGGAGAHPAGAYPAGAPSMLGEVYYAAQGRGALVVGATRRYGLSPEAALAECGRRVDARSGEAAAAARALQPPAAALWPPAAAWQVRGGALGACATQHPTRIGGGCQGWPPSDGCHLLQCRCLRCARTCSRGARPGVALGCRDAALPTPGLLRSLPLPHSPKRPTYAQMAQGPRRRARQVAHVRSGVRAMPPRTQAGKAPLAGRVPRAWLDEGAAAAPRAAEPGSSGHSTAAAVRSGEGARDAAAAARAPSGGPPGASGRRPRERAEGRARLDTDASASDSEADADSAAGLGAELPELSADHCGRAAQCGAGPGPRHAATAGGGQEAVGGGRRWWVVAGLGARGLVYHAWLGRLAAAAVLADDEALLPAELRRWQARCGADPPEADTQHGLPRPGARA